MLCLLMSDQMFPKRDSHLQRCPPRLAKPLSVSWGISFSESPIVQNDVTNAKSIAHLKETELKDQGHFACRKAECGCGDAEMQNRAGREAKGHPHRSI